VRRQRGATAASRVLERAAGESIAAARTHEPCESRGTPISCHDLLEEMFDTAKRPRRNDFRLDGVAAPAEEPSTRQQGLLLVIGAVLPCQEFDAGDPGVPPGTNQIVSVSSISGYGPEIAGFRYPGSTRTSKTSSTPDLKKSVARTSPDELPVLDIRSL
jgi:hypothetical protein